MQGADSWWRARSKGKGQNLIPMLLTDQQPSASGHSFDGKRLILFTISRPRTLLGKQINVRWEFPEDQNARHILPWCRSAPSTLNVTTMRHAKRATALSACPIVAVSNPASRPDTMRHGPPYARRSDRPSCRTPTDRAVVGMPRLFGYGKVSPQKTSGELCWTISSIVHTARSQE